MDSEKIIDTIEKSGSKVKNNIYINEGKNVWKNNRDIKTEIGGLFLFLAFILHIFFAEISLLYLYNQNFLLRDLFFLLAILIGGEHIIRGGYSSLKRFSLDIDLLMSTAILGSLVSSLVLGEKLYFEAATLTFLFNIAELLEDYSIDKAKSSFKELIELSPKTARKIEDGEEKTISIEKLKVGEIVSVKPGERIPVDGKVIKGESSVDQSQITGESIPVDKTEKDEVYSGTINKSGYLEIKVSEQPSNSTISRIIDLVEKAQEKKTKKEQFVERFAQYYTPLIVFIAFITASLPPILLGSQWNVWIVRGITLLVLACPCAFVISTPVTVVSGITSGARNGVLIKGGKHLENMGSINAIAFDKTGTLTNGELEVTDIFPLNNLSQEDVLRCAKNVEKQSEHPIGQAIVEKANKEGIKTNEINEFRSMTGEGVKAKIKGKKHYVGKPSLFEDLGFDLKHVHIASDLGEVTKKSKDLCEKNNCIDLLDTIIPNLEREGKTVILVGRENKLEGIIGVRDTIRKEAKNVIEKLHSLNIEHIVMLTGDNERTAKAMADKLGIDEYRSELLPEDKVKAIDEINKRYGSVAMVGDGINDAPGLVSSTVGIAMGAAGTDTAIETADIALMGDNLSKIPYLYKISKTTNKVIKQNIWTSLLTKLILAIGVPFGYVNVVLAVLIGDTGMTIGVTGNALRLSKIKPDILD